MLRPFKIKTSHLRDYPELAASDVGLYAIRVKEDQELMIYENKFIANKAYNYFEKMLKSDK